MVYDYLIETKRSEQGVTTMNATIIAELTNVFNAADVKDYSGQGLKQVEIIRHWDEDSGYSVDMIEFAEKVAAENNYKLTITRRNRNLYFEA
jgi:hypothetical protein